MAADSLLNLGAQTIKEDLLFKKFPSPHKMKLLLGKHPSLHTMAVGICSASAWREQC
jgi:hypothetical protein